MKNDYTIDKVPYDKLVVEEKEHYGEVYYCHMKGFPDVPVFGSFGTKQYSQSMCDLYNHKSKKSRSCKADEEVEKNEKLKKKYSN